MPSYKSFVFLSALVLSAVASPRVLEAPRPVRSEGLRARGGCSSLVTVSSTTAYVGGATVLLENLACSGTSSGLSADTSLSTDTNVLCWLLGLCCPPPPPPKPTTTTVVKTVTDTSTSTSTTTDVLTVTAAPPTPTAISVDDQTCAYTNFLPFICSFRRTQATPSAVPTSAGCLPPREIARCSRGPLGFSRTLSPRRSSYSQHTSCS
ncbi:hypothetical protein FA95DRAFT_689367 [Auriscalpium vulgare]|uniref:Uncharacterized protein n=1 Tax=Auriscalpium vulgare TaxID=40419 RepID=A0ACB8S0R8_9AGAM|nr:hypothetical protein FA95DRAFT_689367 [Auriscalpium vulgare]